MQIESLIVRYGYFALGLGTVLEGETVLVAAGALAHRGLLSLPLVIVVAFAGSALGDQIWFLVGRKLGQPFIAKRPKWLARTQKIDRWLAKLGWVFVMGFRFLYGIRTVTPAFLGAHHYPWRRFVALNLAGAALWATTFAFAGYLLGASLGRVLHRAGRIEEIVIAALALTSILAYAVKRIRDGLIRARLRHRSAS